MNLQSLFEDFNPSRFLVHCCLLAFTLLFSLRLDGVISWNYWVVFLPLWIWKFMVIVGAVVGSYVWWTHPQYRNEGDGRVHYQAMVISLFLQCLLLVFEVLACDNLQNDRHLWTLVFIPLIFISVLSIAVCIWAVKHDRSFELELFCSVNVLQFIFLALQLDKFIQWSWVVVFVPLWIVMCLAVIGVLYAIIFASILLRTPEVSPEQRRTSLHSAVSYSMIVGPLLVFLVLLSNKLDTEDSLGYTETCTPLYFTFLVLIFLSFGSKGGNHLSLTAVVTPCIHYLFMRLPCLGEMAEPSTMCYVAMQSGSLVQIGLHKSICGWFGIRKDFCQFLLGACPLLQEYGNISYSLHNNEADSPPSVDAVTTLEVKSIPRQRPRSSVLAEPRPIVAALAIDTPD